MNGLLTPCYYFFVWQKHKHTNIILKSMMFILFETECTIFYSHLIGQVIWTIVQWETGCSRYSWYTFLSSVGWLMNNQVTKCKIFTLYLLSLTPLNFSPVVPLYICRVKPMLCETWNPEIEKILKHKFSSAEQD